MIKRIPNLSSPVQHTSGSWLGLAQGLKALVLGIYQTRRAFLKAPAGFAMIALAMTTKASPTGQAGMECGWEGFPSGGFVLENVFPNRFIHPLRATERSRPSHSPSFASRRLGRKPISGKCAAQPQYDYLPQYHHTFLGEMASGGWSRLPPSLPLDLGPRPWLKRRSNVVSLGSSTKTVYARSHAARFADARHDQVCPESTMHELWHGVRHLAFWDLILANIASLRAILPPLFWAPFSSFSSRVEVV